MHVNRSSKCRADTSELTESLLERARMFGADLAGFAAVSDLKTSPTHRFTKIIQQKRRLAAHEDLPAQVRWLADYKTILVVAVHHPDNRPELDWWFGKTDPPGNRTLADIINNLCHWLAKQFNIKSFHLPYHVEKGGIYLKDAAVLAAMGNIGKNNLLITPQFGPRVRLRALALNSPLPSTGPLVFDPCVACAEPCRRSCSKKAIHQSSQITLCGEKLHGPAATFSRLLCREQMYDDIDTASGEECATCEEKIKIIKYCRRCELSCPVGTLWDSLSGQDSSG